MNAKKFSNALGNVRDEYVSEAIVYQNKRKRHNWAKWGIMAACLCIAVCVVVIPFMNTEQPQFPEQSVAPNVLINNTTYIQSAHGIAFETCPNGFEYGGKIESGTAKGCSYYINPQMPEWIYVEHEIKRIGTTDEFYPGYVRYVDENIRGKNFINYNGNIYVLMYHAECPTDIEESVYDEVENSYGLKIEASGVDGFTPIGTTVFEGFDVIPYESFGSNSHQKTQQIYANANIENVILVSSTWCTSFGTHDGFEVYIKSNFEYTTHKNADVIKYNELYFSKSDLSGETVEWLEWYNSLTEEEQLAIDYVPHELYTYDNFETVDADAEQ